ncbi:MAG TPA: efflux RND transporter permease subunit [Ignavibacteria bacterium]|jgi:multidrug efflux pump subunit AcrB
MKKNHNIIQYIISIRNIVFLITGCLLIFGIYAIFNMPRQEFPDFTIRQGLIIGVYPGASSNQVEEHLTSEVEKFLFEFKEINRKKTYSVSKEGMMIIFVEMSDDVKNADQFWAKIRHGLNELKQTLPSGVIALFANSEFGETSAIILSLESETKSYKELEKYLKVLKDELRKNPDVSKIKEFGLQKEQISIYIDQNKLANYGIKPLTLLASLKTEGEVSYGGELDNGYLVHPIHIHPRYQTDKDIAEQIVYTDPFGNVVRLKDIAKIVREYPKSESYVLNNGHKAVLVSLEMHSGNNIVQFGEEIDKIVEKFSSTLPEDVRLNKIANMPEVVQNSVNNFLKEFFIAIFSVILVTMLLLPKKVASIAGITIPISVFITLGIMFILKIPFHTVSLAALIVVLGMIVDNSIVIIDNHIEKLDIGENPWDAAWKSANELFVPVFTATLIISLAFFPLLLFLKGTYYDFISSFPVTIGLALGISLIVAEFLVPILNYLLIKKGLKEQFKSKKRKTFLDILQGFYDKTLEWAFKRKKLVIFIGIGSFLMAILLGLVVKRQLFPFVERNQFAVEIFLPTGSSLTQTEKIVDSLQNVFKNDKRIINYAAFIGTSSPRFHATYAPNLPSNNYAQFVITTVSNEATENILSEYSNKYYNAFPEAHIKWKQLELTDKSAPIEIRISGDSIKELKKISEKVKNILKSTNGVYWARDDFEEPMQSINLDLNFDEMNRLGLSKSLVSYSIAAGFTGIPLTTVWEDDYPVKVVLRLQKNKHDSYNDLYNQYITSPLLGTSIHLRQIATPLPEWNEGVIVRRNGIRTITIRGDVQKGVYVSEVLDKVKPEIDKIILPDGYSKEYGGELEGEKENYSMLSVSLLTSIIISFFILLFQFRKIKLSLLILITMPLSIFGAILGLIIINYPFSFTSFVGIISLCGMVVRNGIIYVDYAENIRKENKLSPSEAAIAAGKRRMRPIFLTSAAASVGVIPMIISKSSLWGPLATVICFGLIFAMILSLYVLPVLYEFVTKKENKIPIEENV